MDVWGLTIAALRRWYVLLPLLALSLTAAYLVGARAQAEYEVNGAVMLVVPPQRYPNPYADDYASEILGIRVGSSSTREDFESQGLSGEYEIDYERRSPIMSIKVVSSSEAVAVKTAEEIIGYLDDVLEAAQEVREVPKGAQVTLEVVDAPDTAEPVVSGRLRVTGMVAVAGGILSLACAVFLDAILIRRRRRVETAAAPSSDLDTGAEPRAAGLVGVVPRTTLSQG